MDVLSSAVGLDFDMALLVIASGLYRLLARRMRGPADAQHVTSFAISSIAGQHDGRGARSAGALSPPRSLADHHRFGHPGFANQGTLVEPSNPAHERLGITGTHSRVRKITVRGNPG